MSIPSPTPYFGTMFKCLTNPVDMLYCTQNIRNSDLTTYKTFSKFKKTNNMKKVILMAVIATAVISTSFAQLQPGDTLNVRLVPVTRQHSGQSNKIAQQPINLQANITTPENNITVQPAPVYVLNGSEGKESGFNTNLIIFAVIVIVIAAFFFFGGGRWFGASTEDIINAVGNNGGEFRGKGVRFKLYRPTTITTQLRNGEEARAAN